MITKKYFIYITKSGFSFLDRYHEDAKNFRGEYNISWLITYVYTVTQNNKTLLMNKLIIVNDGVAHQKY